MLLEIKDLTIKTSAGKAIVEDVGFSVENQTIVGLVGGSGSGKTSTGLAVLKLLSPSLRIEKGEVLFNGVNLLDLTENELCRIRGKDIGMVFQEPLTAFNPVFPIGKQIGEVLKYHTDLSQQKRKDRVAELLDLVGIPDARRVAENYPHQLSGGMRQRAMLAQAIAAGPKLLIADEPTSSLDVTHQARIMELFQKLRDELKLSVLLITHDLGLVEHFTEEMIVMSSGKVIEKGKTKEIMRSPGHYYTRRLMEVLKI